MEYERIHKVQTGIISPSKLRLKLIGPHHQRRKEGTNSNSSRTSPSKLDDAEFVKNGLLDANNGDFVEEGSSKDFEDTSAAKNEAPCAEASLVKLSGEGAPKSSQGDQTCSQPKDETGHGKIQHLSRGVSGNSSAVHPMRALEEDSLDYDSAASSSSFEFHKGERSLRNSVVRPFPRPVPSKWNDAEKWLVNRQSGHPTYPKKTISQSQVNRVPVGNMVRVAPELASFDYKTSVAPVADTKRVDFCEPASQTDLEKFSFLSGIRRTSGLANEENGLIDLCPLSKDEKEVNCNESSERPTSGTTAFPNVRSVSMRDMGTEMTPVTSQEPSRTATPVGATTPLRSPASSIPSTPRRGAPAPSPLDATTDDEQEHQNKSSKKELSEQEMKLKTRREIVALGVQLGKMNIAAWAGRDEKEANDSPFETIDPEQLKRDEYENRAAAWEEAEKSKHNARYKRDEIKIQAWESHQKAKLEAEMRRIEAQVEQMRTYAQEKMMKRIAIARQKSEEKRASAEAKRNQQASRTAAQAEYIRQTGRIPSSNFNCCSWLS